MKTIRQRGLRYSFAILFNRIVPLWLFRCRRFVIYELDPTQFCVDSANNSSVKWCETETEIASIEKMTGFNRSFSTGESRAVQATADGKLAAGFWAAYDQFDESELGVRVLLPPRAAWLFAANVLKRFRRRGIYSQILNFVGPELKNQGKTRLLVAVNPDNLASNRIHQQFAAGSPGTVFALRFLSTTICVTLGRVRRDRLISWNSTRKPIEIRID